MGHILTEIRDDLLNIRGGGGVGHGRMTPVQIVCFS